MADTEGERSFKVHDRRRFSETGEPRTENENEPAEGKAAKEAEAAPKPAQAPAEPEAPPIDFATFTMSLSTQALAHLGEIPDPTDGATRVDLGAARQVIDILAMLREKTQGNLDSAERALLDNLLYNLRMKFVDRTQGR
jgi:Domain of unknown function (DUF1844)